MKNAKKWLLGLASLAVCAGAYAQDYMNDPNYGATPEERQRVALVVNLFRDAYEIKNYDQALQYMYELIEKAPKSTLNIYIRGVNMFKTKYNQAQSREMRNQYADSVMYLYDLRVEHFPAPAPPSQGKVELLIAKANDFLVLNPFDRERIRQYFNDAIEATEGKDAILVNTYFKVLVDDYKSDMVGTDELLNEYERLSGFFADTTDPAMAEGLKTFEALLLSSGAANCDKLEELYKPRYEADPNNVELMNKIVNMLGRTKCTSDFMLLVMENLYKVQPDPQTGVFLASFFEQKQDYEKSLFYWQESINSESDPSIKKEYILGAATSALAANNYRQAVTFARQVLDIDPENGNAYMIIGQAYGAGSANTCSGFDKNAALWLAVDNLQRARGLLSGDAAQTEVLNRMINTLTSGFPTTEECFYMGDGLKTGDSYTVNCGWISGRTTVRTIQ